jgi:hypothetical protein
MMGILTGRNYGGRLGEDLACTNALHSELLVTSSPTFESWLVSGMAAVGVMLAAAFLVRG